MRAKGVLFDHDIDGAMPVQVEISCQGDEIRIEFCGKRGFELRVKREDLIASMSQEEHG